MTDQQFPCLPTIVVHLTDEGVLEAVCADTAMRVILLNYMLSESETAVMGPDGDPAVITSACLQPDPERVAAYARSAELPVGACKGPVELLEERDEIAAHLAPLGYLFTGGGVGFGAWDMSLEYPGWELFVNSDGREYTLTAYPAEREEGDDPTIHAVCATRQALVEQLSQLRPRLDGADTPARHLIILRDNGRIEHLLSNTPDVQVTVFDTGSDQHDDGRPLLPLPDGTTALVHPMPVTVDAEHSARLLRAAHPDPGGHPTAPPRLLVVWNATPAPSLVTAEACTVPPHPFELGRQIVRHLMTGGVVEVISLPPHVVEGDLSWLQEALRSETVLDRLRHVTIMATYHTLDAFLNEAS